MSEPRRLLETNEDLMPTNAERILTALCEAGRPLSDRDLQEATGISPRAQVNQLCNRLARSGLTVREPGVNGAMMNRLPGPDEFVERSQIVTSGGSLEQQRAERIILDALEAELGVPLGPRRLVSPSGAVIDVDGVSEDGSILAECWAHQGAAKAAQKYKLVNDATKLHWASTWLEPKPVRLLLCVTDEAAVQHLRGRSWQARAIEDRGVEVQVLELPSDVVAGILAAQKRQFR